MCQVHIPDFTLILTSFPSPHLQITYNRRISSIHILHITVIMPPPRIRIPSLSNLSLVPSLRQPLPFNCLRSFSSSPQQNASHGPSYDPPSGWLFGVPPGQKYQKEGWENIWIYGFWGSLLVLGVGGWVWREDTSYVHFCTEVNFDRSRVVSKKI